MTGWLRDKSCRFKAGDFNLIRHEPADEDADPHQGKILVGCTLCRAHYNDVKPKACPDRSFAWATNVGCFGRKLKALHKHLDSALHQGTLTKQVRESQSKSADMPSHIHESKTEKRQLSYGKTISYDSCTILPRTTVL
jgi:hypothetical protein